MSNYIIYRTIFYKDILQDENYISIDKEDLYDENHIWVYDTYSTKYYADFNKYSYITFKDKIKQLGINFNYE